MENLKQENYTKNGHSLSKAILPILFIMLTIFVFTSCETSTSYEKTTLGIKIDIDSTTLEIQLYSPSIARVIKSPTGNGFEKESLSVIKNPESVDFSVTENDELIKVSTEEMEISIDKESGSIVYESPEETLLKEKKGSVAFTPFDDNGNETYSVSQTFSLDSDEAIYGLGLLQNGKMSQRNQKVRMVQNNTWDFVTFIQSVKGYGVFWDNYSPTTFNDDSTGMSFTSEVGDGIDYYFMVGKDADGVVSEMRDLTGEVPMFPLWTYGYWQSKERYKSQEETIGVVEKYRDLGVPLDGIIQDWQYWGDNYHWNAMEFLNPSFPDPQKFVDDVHDLNAHMIISIWSSFGPETAPYKGLAEKDMLMDFLTWPLSGKDVWPPDMDYPSGVKVYDAYHPEARDIYWNHLKEGLFSLGLDGWWMDSTEPDHLEFKTEDLNNETYLGSFRKVRNAYPLVTVGGVYDHQREVTADKRVFILTRSAFAGQQRYGASTWTGDVVASWGALENQISAGLNFSLCGNPHWNSDIGGFFLWDFPQKLEDPEYRELYTRWLQFGAFTPMMRSHGTDAPREIYRFGKKGDPLYDAIEKFIHLRYSLLPYIYATSWDVTMNQSTMTRPLVMDFSNDTKTHDLNDQYLFGKSLLIAPVTDPMYFQEKISGKDTFNVENFDTIKSSEVYLPDGTDWFDFWTNEKLEGGQTVTRETPIDIIPIYAKAGSIIPIGPKVQFAEEKDWSDLEIRIYPGEKGSFTLYEDEGDNYNYEDGGFSEIGFQWDDSKKILTIGARKGEFEGMIESRSFNIVLIDGQKEITTKNVAYSGNEMVLNL